MAITILDMPDGKFRGASLRPVPVQQINRSAYTRTRQIFDDPWHVYWRLTDAEHVPVQGLANIQPWYEWRAKLNGQANYFRFPAVEADQHEGSVVATVKSSSGSTNLVIDNLPASVTYLPHGRLTVILDDGHEQLIELTAPLITNVSGEATASFWPPLRGDPEVDSTVETKNPWVVLALADPELPIAVAPGQFYSFTLAGEEDW
jgi:hypothetical protein